MRKIFALVALSILSILSSCGGELPRQMTVTELGAFIDIDAASSKDRLIDCYNGYCDSSYQYCLRSTMSLDDTDYKTAYCRPKFEKCNDCTCAKYQSQRHFSMAKNCKGEIYCEQEGEKIIVTCVVPQKAS